MDLTILYAICLSSLLILFCIVTHRPSGQHVRRCWIRATNFLSYAYLVNRHRIMGPWRLSAVFLTGLYTVVTFGCLCFNLSLNYQHPRAGKISLKSKQEIATASGYISLINFIPLFLSPHHSFLADLIGLPLKAYRRIHSTCGTTAFALFALHTSLLIPTLKTISITDLGSGEKLAVSYRRTFISALLTLSEVRNFLLTTVDLTSV